MDRPTPRVFAVLVALALVVSGCGRDRSRGAAADGDGLSGTITVAAAASLTEALTRIAEDFEAAHPDTEIELTFDSSTSLAGGIVAGAPADVFASAEERSVARLADAGLTRGEPVVIARNRLAIVTKPGNPERIRTLADLAAASTVSLCAEAAPCGTFTDRVLARAGAEIPEGNVTRGQNVRATLAAVTEGDAVAGIVYVTDGLGAGDRVEVVDIPEAEHVVAVYPAVVLAGSPHQDVAEAFVAYVAGDAGRRTLEGLGFLPPA